MAEVKDVTIVINVKDGDIKKTENDFKKLNGTVNKGSKEMTGSLNNMNKSLLSVGAALGGAFAIKAVVGDAIQRIVGFEKAISSLSAITGATGKDLDVLKGKVLSVAKDTKRSATEVAGAFELIGSKAPKLLENADALAKVTKEAITLSKASGEDLSVAAGALTGVMNQFNLEATESERIINALAAGSQKGAAPVGDISAAIDKFGTVAAAANVSVEGSIGLVETLAEKNINGAEAGTQLRNIILKLQAANIGFTDGVFNLNDALEEVKNKNLSAAESAKLFGLESVTAGNILVNGTDTINKYTEAVTGTSTANEQAKIQMENLAGQTEELDAAYESLILSIEDGSGALSELSKEIIGTTTNLVGFLTNLNDGNGFMESFNDLIADQAVLSGGLKEQSEALGVSQESLFKAYQNNEESLIALGTLFQKGKITIEQYREQVGELAGEYGHLTMAEREAEKEQDSIIAKKKAQIAAAKAYKDGLKDETLAIDDNTEAEKDNSKAKEKALSFYDKLMKKVKDAKETLKEQDLLNTIFEDDTSGEEDRFLKELGLDEDGLEKLKEQQKEKRELLAENAAAELEQNIIFQELELEQQQIFADAKQQINEQLAFSALGLAGAIAQAAGDSQAAQQAALLFDKTAAVASIIINTQKANALLAGQLGVAAAPLIVKNNIAGALGVATVLATAIPQARQIQESDSPKKLKDGEVRIKGPGTRTSDSIPALLSKDESVINANSTIKHEAALKAINDDRFDEYLNRVVMQRLYMGKPKESISIKEAKKQSIQFPKGFRVTNAKDISKGLVDAFNEHAFLNQNDGWQ